MSVSKNGNDTFWVEDLFDYFNLKYQKLLDRINDPERPYYGEKPDSPNQLVLEASNLFSRELFRFVTHRNDFRNFIGPGRNGFRNKNGILMIRHLCIQCNSKADLIEKNSDKVFCGESCQNKYYF